MHAWIHGDSGDMHQWKVRNLAVESIVFSKHQRAKVFSSCSIWQYQSRLTVKQVHYRNKNIVTIK
jgi:hypothetical protein